MEALIFFLFGLPLAFVANQAVQRFARPYDEDEAIPSGRKRLVWQTEPWASRMRLGVISLIPLLSALAGSRFATSAAVLVSLLVAGLLVCTATDLLRHRVPNAITYPGTVLVLGASLFMPGADIKSAIIAAVLGGLVFLVMSIVTRGGMGLGDVKLAMLIGAALGLQGAYQALVYGIMAGGIIIFVLLMAGVVGRRQHIPYAPFLALSAVVVVLLHGAAFAPL